MHVISYVGGGFFEFIFALIVIYGYYVIFKYTKMESEFNNFKKAIYKFETTGKERIVTINRKTMKYIVKHELLDDNFIEQFKQILQKYPFEKKFDIEVGNKSII